MAGEWVKASAAAGAEEGNELGVVSEAKAAILAKPAMMGHKQGAIMAAHALKPE
jgi:hypothetical protein